MIKRVTIEYFKCFEKQEFELPNHVVLAGPNNSGKTTLLQAIALWNFALQKWIEGTKGNRTTRRSSLPVTWNEFTVIPVREMKFLWWNNSTAFRTGEGENSKPGYPKHLKIGLDWIDHETQWAVAFELTYANTRLIYVKPSSDSLADVNKIKEDVSFVHVPTFSGIGVEEIPLPRINQDASIGQGKPGDVIRNLLCELYSKRAESDRPWDALCREIQALFGYELLPPDASGRYIICDYKVNSLGNGRTQFDIASAGSGFHQVLLLLTFYYARPSSVFLLDEPDAHQHVCLQKQIFDRLREITKERSCQLIITTHSEVVIDSTLPENIISFYGTPHSLKMKGDKDQALSALKLLHSSEILLVDKSAGILYVEGETDFNLLKAWAELLGHKSAPWFSDSPLWRSNVGRNVKDAKRHFLGLKAIKPYIQGYLLLDGDDRGLTNHIVSADGLAIGRWRRYEAESYLLLPSLLERFVSKRVSPSVAASAKDYLQDQLPRVVINNPLADHEFLLTTPASKTIIPQFMEIAGVSLAKNEYYLIAKEMLPEEIHPEIIRKLDEIYEVVKEKTSIGEQNNGEK